jgi:hypothetical protein
MQNNGLGSRGDHTAPLRAAGSSPQPRPRARRARLFDDDDPADVIIVERLDR